MLTFKGQDGRLHPFKKIEGAIISILKILKKN